MTGTEMAEEMKRASLLIQLLLDEQNLLERKLTDAVTESKTFGAQLEKFSKNIERISQKAPEGKVTLVFTGIFLSLCSFFFFLLLSPFPFPLFFFFVIKPKQQKRRCSRVHLAMGNAQAGHGKGPRTP
jgi:hypothetical protein